MTRENKLAMVVGFGLLLFVGILVSDHFSAAQRQETTRIARSDADRTRVTREVSLAPVAVADSVQPESMPSQSIDTRAASYTAPANQARPVDPVAPTTVKAVASGKRQESDAGVRMRPIAEGETLYSICKKEYGDGSLATALAAYNQKAVPDPKRVRKGVTIRLPPVEVLRPGTKGTRAQAAPAAAPAPATEPAVNESQVPALAVVDVVAAETRTPVGGVVTVDVAPGGVKGGASAKSGSKSSDPKPAKKPSKKPSSRPVASKPTVS